MRRTTRIMLCVVLVAALGWLAWKPVRSMYVTRRADLQERAGSLTADLDRYRDAGAEHRRIADELAAYVDRTLGGDLQTVDHQLRSRLNRIGEELGLEGLSVGTGRSRRLETPAKSQFNRRLAELRDEIDFVEVEAWISGQGDYDQVLRVVRRVESEPWIKRIQQVRLQPRDNGGRFAVTVRLVTLFLPGRVPAKPLPNAGPAGLEAYEQLVARNPFQVPSPEPPPAEEVVVATAAPAPAYAQWTLTGVASGDGLDVEVWLLNAVSGESRRLAVGQTLHDLKLVAADGGVAEFGLGDDLFSVSVGQRLIQK